MLCNQVPDIDWFARQREALGLEASVYAYRAVGQSSPHPYPVPLPLPYSFCPSQHIAGCDEVLQWGFDETTLDGQACFNQWCLVRKGEDVTVVTIECAGVLPCSTAAETVRHIQKTWERGQVLTGRAAIHDASLTFSLLSVKNY